MRPLGRNKNYTNNILSHETLTSKTAIMKNLLFLFSCSFFLLSVEAHTQTLNKDWPQADGFSERTGYVETTMGYNFNYDVADVGKNIGTYSYVDGVAYVGYSDSEGNTYRALDVNTGDILWDFVVPESRGGINYYAAVSEDVVILGGQNGKGLYGVDRMTGDSLWFIPTESQYGRNVAIKGNLGFVQASSYGLLCFDIHTGNIEWTFREGATQSVPLVDDDHVYYTTRTSDTLYALTHNGERVWNFVAPMGLSDFDATMSKGDTVFLKTRSHLFALNQNDGAILWQTTLSSDRSFGSNANALAWSPHALIVHEWIGDWRDTFMVQGFNRLTGQMMWSDVLAPGSGSPGVAFGDYVANVSGGDLQIRHARTGDMVNEITGFNFDAYPRLVVVDGEILASRENSIYRFKAITTGNDDAFNSADWKIIDNPVANILRLSYEGTTQFDASYQITHLSGQMFQSGQINLTKNQFSELQIAHIPPGSYVLSLGQNGLLGSKVFLKE